MCVCVDLNQRIYRNVAVCMGSTHTHTHLRRDPKCILQASVRESFFTYTCESAYFVDSIYRPFYSFEKAETHNLNKTDHFKGVHPISNHTRTTTVPKIQITLHNTARQYIEGTITTTLISLPKYQKYLLHVYQKRGIILF